MYIEVIQPKSSYFSLSLTTPWVLQKDLGGPHVYMYVLIYLHVLKLINRQIIMDS